MRVVKSNRTPRRKEEDPSDFEPLRWSLNSGEVAKVVSILGDIPQKPVALRAVRSERKVSKEEFLSYMKGREPLSMQELHAISGLSPSATQIRIHRLLTEGVIEKIPVKYRLKPKDETETETETQEK